MDNINIGQAPNSDSVTIDSVETPVKPEINFPDVPTLDELTMPVSL